MQKNDVLSRYFWALTVQREAAWASYSRDGGKARWDLFHDAKEREEAEFRRCIGYDGAKLRRLKIYRVKGAKLPAKTRVITRNTPFGNPHKIEGRDGGFYVGNDFFALERDARECSVRLFNGRLERMRKHEPEALARLLVELSKFDAVACSCNPWKACHGDVWIKWLGGEDWFKVGDTYTLKKDGRFDLHIRRTEDGFESIDRGLTRWVPKDEIADELIEAQVADALALGLAKKTDPAALIHLFI